MSNLLKLTTLTVLGLASLDQTLAAEAAAETGVGECLLRTGRGVTTPYLGNLKSGDEVPYSSRKVSSTINPRHELTGTPRQHKDMGLVVQTMFQSVVEWTAFFFS